MYRLVFLLLLSSLALAYISKGQEEISPQGDTHMGADAVGSGTDLDDEALQAQEENRAKPNANEGIEKTKIDKKNTGEKDGLPPN